MKDVTLYLSPYAGELPAKPTIRNCNDLTQNYYLARKLIRAANILFHMRKGAATFCGYVFERPIEATFVMKVIHKGRVIRTLKFTNLGYGGLLRIELCTQKIEDAITLDVLASLVDSRPGRKPVKVA
jgi:hypothetical protein